VCIEVEEQSIPVSDEVTGICEMLGFEASALANEGTFVLAINKDDADKALEILKTFEANTMASIIGKVTQNHLQKVVLNSAYGTQRFLDTPTGELLPRIC
jgi:hydrogenase expression/formation protein HypE